MPGQLQTFDFIVLVIYMLGVFGLGCWFARKSGTTGEFMAAGRSLPGWAVGLSVFGTYVSSIGFLGNTGAAFSGNWNMWVFGLSLPIAAFFAVKYFIPLYRGEDHISAYYQLEKRFGPWARLYAMLSYLLSQLARIGTILYLVALALSPLTGWDIRQIIVVTGILVTIYTLIGGIEAVIWTDVVQSFVLVGGAILCAGLLLTGDSGSQLFEVANAEDKFSLGGFSLSPSTLTMPSPTFWMVLLYGVFINLANFGIDQSFVQRYITAKTDRDAKFSIWLACILFPLVSALFFFIGTGLYAHAKTNPEFLAKVQASVEQRLPEDISPEEKANSLSMKGIGDKVLPQYIITNLPNGLAGLLIAAIFAAAMSSMDTSLNSSASLVLCDVWQKYVNPDASERESMRVLYGATLGIGVIGTLTALAMLRVESALAAWWTLQGIFTGGMLGLFLLGLISTRTRNHHAMVAVAIGVLVTLWLSLSNTAMWPAAMVSIANPLHKFMTNVVGTSTIILVGVALATLLPAPDQSKGPLKPLRWWPATLLMAAMFVLRWVPTLWQNGPASIWMAAAFGPALCAILILLWWIIASRASVSERVTGFVGCLAALAATVAFVHPSLRGPAILVVTIPLGMAMFGLGAAICSHTGTFHRTIIAILMAACGFGSSLLLRSDGMWGDFAPDLAWRWQESSEEQFLADLEKHPASTISPDAGTLNDMLAEPEWPGFRGLDRTSQVYGGPYSKSWITEKPENLWSISIGPGWSSFAVAGDFLFTQEQRGADECVLCYDAKSGREIWARHIESRFEEAIGGPGPRATPTLANGGLFAMSAEGFLLRLDPKTGDVVWQTDLRVIADRQPPMWGFASSPLVVDSIVIVHAGGSNDKGIFGFDIESGDVVWSAAAGDHSYSSPQLCSLGDEQLVAVATNDGVNFLRPESGEEELNYVWPHEGYRTLQPQVIPPDSILIPTGQGTGTRRIRLERTDGNLVAQEAWTSLELKPDFNDFVVHDGHAYGFDGLLFTCIDLESGKRRWKRGRYGKGQVLLLVDSGLLLVASEKGEAVLLQADPAKHKELGRFQAIQGKTWNHPVVVGERLYIRNGEEAACYRLPMQ